MRRLVILILLIGGLVVAYPATVQASSPPTGQVAFERHGDIWIMDADGGHARRLTVSSKTESRPAWSPDGRTIAFIRAGKRDAFNVCLNEIWLMDAGGAHKRRVSFVLGPKVMPGTTHKQTSYGVDALTWAPGGSDITVCAGAASFYPDTAGGLFALQVYLVHPNGTHQRRLGPLQFGATIDSLSWRPDGSQLLLIPNWKGFGCLHAYDVAADSWSEPYGERAMWAAVYSPEGNRIAALVEGGASSAEGARGGYIPHPRHLTVINLRTEEERTLTVPGVSDLALAQPTWSPDGQSISYVSDDRGSPQIYTISRSGGEPTRLTRSPSYNTEPAWSRPPAGSDVKPALAVTSRVGGQFQVGVYEEGTGAVTPKAADGDCTDPTWAPDGHHLVFGKLRGYRSRLYLLDVRTNEQLELFAVDGESSEPAWGPRH